MSSKISAKRVRYIKLGEGGRDEKECIEKNIIRIGFGSETHFDLCREGKWEELEKQYRSEGRKKGKPKEFTNQVRAFFEDDGKILWITFSERKLWWAFIDGGKPAETHPLGGTFRPIQGEWQSKDRKGRDLHMSDLSGRLTQKASYRGTSCEVRDVDYLIRRINCEPQEVVRNAEELREQLERKILEMIRQLSWRDFELLVDLVFSSSGWRRLGVAGKNEKTVDMEIFLPSTKERAFIQVKSATTQEEFGEYLSAFEKMKEIGRMFFVYHTGNVTCTDDKVTVIGPDDIGGRVFEAGLLSWLINRVS